MIALLLVLMPPCGQVQLLGIKTLLIEACLFLVLIFKIVYFDSTHAIATPLHVPYTFPLSSVTQYACCTGAIA
jgi:hypothetical protein